MADPYQIAIDQLAAYGLAVEQLDTSGKLRRVKTSDDKGSKKSGWYVAHEFTLDSGRTVITGRYGNWKVSPEAESFQFDAKFTTEEKAKFKAQQESQRRAAEKEKRERHKQAANRAAAIWPKLPTEGHSPYLQRKTIAGLVCRYGKSGSIAIPIGKNGALTGLQWIESDGSKKFLTGTEKQGAYCYLQGEGDTVYLCEGYATGASIRMATECSVLVCFDAGNLVTVANDLAARSPDKAFVIAADNDHQKASNKGLAVAVEIVNTHPQASMVFPVFDPDDPGTDFNDLHVSQGLDAVRQALTGSQPKAYPANFAEPEPENIPTAAESVRRGGDSRDSDDWAASIKRSDKGAVLPLSSNIALVLNNDPAWREALSYCDFSYRIIKRRDDLPDCRAGEWEDADTARLAVWLSNRYGFEPPRAKITDAIIVVAQQARFHPVREYLGGLKWDGVPRIDNWLEDVYEATADDPRYLQAVGAKFLIGAVARVMSPGCKMDNVMILEGRQGLRKSSSVAQLFGDWFSDAPIPIGDKDAYQNIQGVWCSELAELDSFNKAESTSAKMFFSQVRDRYRPSYGVHAQDYPRQTIFVGTTNQGEYLKDYTGNRRYWPVKCNIANIDLIRQSRDQYWAEAVHRYQQNEPWWPDDSTREIFEEEQDSRMQIDPWHYRIDDWMQKQAGDYWTSNDIIAGAIEKDLAQVTRADQTRISPIMHKLGYKNIKKRVQVGDEKRPRHVYVRANS